MHHGGVPRGAVSRAMGSGIRLSQMRMVPSMEEERKVDSEEADASETIMGAGGAVGGEDWLFAAAAGASEECCGASVIVDS
jgi:hypothetical protein